MTDVKTLANALDKWTQEVEKKLSKRPERKAEFVNTSGIPIKRLYTPLDQSEENYESSLGFPGEYPFTRGVQPTMYRGRFWTMRQYAGFASAEESNKRYRFLSGPGTDGAYPLPLICPPRSATIQTTKWPSAKWERWVWPSTPWRIWKPSSMKSPWIKSAPP